MTPSLTTFEGLARQALDGVSLEAQAEAADAFHATVTPAVILALIARIRRDEEALRPFAESPNSITASHPCHAGICTKDKCGRCSRAIAAWNALSPTVTDG